MGSIQPSFSRRAPSYRRIISSDPLASIALIFLVVILIAWWPVRAAKGSGAAFILAVIAGAFLAWRVMSAVSLLRDGAPVIGRVISVDWRKSLLRRTDDPLYNEPDEARIGVRYVFNGQEYTSGRTLNRRAASDLTPGVEVALMVDRKRPWRFVFEHLS